MAKQDSPNRLRGTVAGINYFKTRNGFGARDASTTINAQRIATDPAFARTRENMSEFGHAGYAGGLLRKAVAEALVTAKDGKLVSRLTREMMRVVKSDSNSLRGERNVLGGELALLQGFDFNTLAPLSTACKAGFTATIDRITGAAVISLPGFQPDLLLVAPPAATHYVFTACGAEIDFAGGAHTAVLKDSGALPFDSVPTAPLQLTLALPAASVHPLFLLLGIQFFQQVNGVNYALKGGTFNALGIVRVDV